MEVLKRWKTTLTIGSVLLLNASFSLGQNEVVSLSLINADNNLPISDFDPLAEGAVISLAALPTANLNIRANVTSEEGETQSVQFSLTGATTQSITESVNPYALGGDSNGNYNAMVFNEGSLTLSATPYSENGAAGNAGPTLTVNFQVVSELVSPPSVSITSPTNGTFFPEPASIQLQAEASDFDGSVTQVEFLVDGTTSLGVDTESPYSISWDEVPTGNYTLTAVATDNEDQSTTSAPVSVQVVVPGSEGSVTGELKQWHAVAITFDGPTVSETDNPSPFLEYRLDVTLTGPSGQVFVVPGFFAADGKAGVTGATSGNKWRVRFAPDEVGEWNYLASFTQGTNASVEGGGALVSFNGATGTFTIEASDKSGADFRSPDKGLIKNRGHHYLTFASGQPWVKGGPDIPENFLGYIGFDNTPSPGSNDNRHDFAAHIQDWRPGDPDWDSPDQPGSNDGRGIIGALNFIADTGSNCIYFLPMNIGGDAKDTFPTLSSSNKTQYDVSKLAQWNVVLAHAQSRGIFLHWVLAETESGNENYHDGGTLGPERKLFYRELHARFGYLLGSEWDIGEENDYGSSKHRQFAAHLKNIDPYDHPVTTHIHTNQFDNFYGPLLGNQDIDKTTFQANLNGLRLTQEENEIEEWRRRSREAGAPWMVSVDEPQKIENDPTDPNNGYPHGRTDFLWPIYLSGAGGFEWYVQEDGGGHSFDQRINDYHEMESALRWTGYALEFMNQLPLLEMEPDKTLASSTAGGTTYCMAKAGDTYALYHKNGGTLSLDLSAHNGEFSVSWFDPRNGGELQLGSVTQVAGGNIISLGAPPNAPDEDWAVLVKAAKKILFIRGADRSGGFLEGSNDESRTEHLADINNFSTNNGNHGWGELSDALRGAGFVVEQLEEPLEDGAPSTGQTEGRHLDLESIGLSQYAVIVFGSNNANDYDQAAIEALENYVRDGGSALFISDANFGGDWCDAANSDQQFLDRFGLVMNQDRGTYSLTRSGEDFLVPDHPIFEGVDAFDGEGVSPGFIPSGSPPPGVSITRLTPAGNTRNNDGVPGVDNCRGSNRAATDQDGALIIATADTGRIAIHFDRNTFFNTNGVGSEINKFDNRQYALNLFQWLADGEETEEPARTYSTWIASFFPDTNDPNIIGQGADPDEDGQNNLSELAFGLNPSLPDSKPLAQSDDRLVASGLPFVLVDRNQGGSTTFRLLFTRPMDYNDLGLNYQPRRSPTLSGWTEISDPPTVLDVSDGLQLVSVPFSLDQEGDIPIQFLQLNVNSEL